MAKADEGKAQVLLTINDIMAGSTARGRTSPQTSVISRRQANDVP